MNKVLIRMHDKDIDFPTHIKQGDWIDLRSAEDIDLEPFQSYILNLGVSIKLPDGYFALLAPRSSMYKNFKILQNDSIGVIDNSYSGDDDVWKLPILAIEKTHIRKNDRVCQFTIIKKEEFDIEIVDHLNGPNRGGFGSTGID